MINVTKANGEKEPFSKDKLMRSIQRAHVPQELQEKLLSHIQEKLYDQISTSEIYSHISDFLGKSDKPYTKGRYSLKKAIMDLGPSGYPFEDYVSEILKRLGFVTNVRVMVLGRCVTHEIDVIAEKDGKKVMVEAKFHNMVGTKTRIHVALYTKARFEDITKNNNFNEAWLITNTKTTTDVIDYANCVGMKVISWSYPEKGSLTDLIEQSGLHPVTSITTLSNSQIQTLLENHIVLAQDICKNPSLLNSLHIDPHTRDSVLTEAQFMCDQL